LAPAFSAPSHPMAVAFAPVGGRRGPQLLDLRSVYPPMNPASSLNRVRGSASRASGTSMADRKPAALISEETELGRWALTRALEAEGFEVTAVPTWAEASAWLLQEDFSMVLLAVLSAPGNAAEIVADITRDHPHTHVVLLADADSVGALRVACGPVPDILPKPLDMRSVARVAVQHSGTA